MRLMRPTKTKCVLRVSCAWVCMLCLCFSSTITPLRTRFCQFLRKKRDADRAARLRTATIAAAIACCQDCALLKHFLLVLVEVVGGGR